MPRRGSRVRIPSRALKEIEKESSNGWLFFLCSSPAGLERFECLRSAPVVAGERPGDVLRRLVLSKKCEKEEISDGYLLFFSHVRAWSGLNGSKSWLRSVHRRRHHVRLKIIYFFRKIQATSDFCAIMLYYEKVRCIKRGE